jgi:hypothetical protein
MCMVVHKAIGRQNRNFLKTKQVIYGLYYELLRSVNDLSGVYIIQHSLYHIFFSKKFHGV